MTTKKSYHSSIQSFCILISMSVSISCSLQHQTSFKNGLNNKFTNPNLNVNRWIEGFENKERDVYTNRANIVKALNIKRGSCVADIGAGTGGFLPLLHKAVDKKGRVFAVEISERFLEYMAKRGKIENLTTVEVIKGEYTATNLKTGSCDTLLLVDVYHHLDNSAEMIKDFAKVLRPNGILAIVDFNRIEGKSRPWILKHTKLSKKDIISQVTKEGFSFYKEAAIPFKENVMLIFKRK